MVEVDDATHKQHIQINIRSTGEELIMEEPTVGSEGSYKPSPIDCRSACCSAGGSQGVRPDI